VEETFELISYQKTFGKGHPSHEWKQKFLQKDRPIPTSQKIASTMKKREGERTSLQRRIAAIVGKTVSSRDLYED